MNTHQNRRKKPFLAFFLPDRDVGVCLGTCFAGLASLPKVGVVLDTNSDSTEGTLSSGVPGAPHDVEMRCAYPAATLRRAVKASRRWFHWHVVQTSTT